MRLYHLLCAAVVLSTPPLLAQTSADYEVQQRRALELLRRTEQLVRGSGKTESGSAVRPPNVGGAAGSIVVPSGPARELALLVGVNRYQAVKPLRGCVNDVRNMRGLLIGKFGFKPENVIVLTDEQATHAAIIDVFRRHLIDRAQPDSVVVFHFSGHGSQTYLDPFGGDETIVPVDSRTPDVYDINASEMGDLIVELERTTKQATFVLDCCRTMGTISRAAAPIAPRVRYVESDPRTSVAPAPGLTQFRSGGPAFRSRLDPQGFTSIAGCSPEEFSFETNDPDTNEPCGAFTNLFVSELQRSTGSPPTWRQLMPELKRGLTARNITQTPTVEMGTADRVVFSGATPRERASFVVNPHADEAEFAADAAQGLMVGSRWEVCPAGVSEFPRGRGVCRLEFVPNLQGRRSWRGCDCR